MNLSSKPYLIRALNEWIVDNGWVPHLLVDAKVSGVQVPDEHIGVDGHIVLNISPDATRGLLISNDRIIFTTRFSGVSYQIFLPPVAVRAIYAKENGEGMVFPEETFDEEEYRDGAAQQKVTQQHPISPLEQKPAAVKQPSKPKNQRPKLTVVK